MVGRDIDQHAPDSPLGRGEETHPTVPGSYVPEPRRAQVPPTQSGQSEGSPRIIVIRGNADQSRRKGR